MAHTIIKIKPRRGGWSIFKPFRQQAIAFSNKLVPNIGRKVIMRELIITR